MNRISRLIDTADLQDGRRRHGWPPAVSARLILFCTLLAAAGLGCGDDEDCPSCVCICNCPSQYPDAVVMTGNLPSLTSVPYLVDSVRVDGRHLSMGVTVSGGCSEHCYRLYLSEHFAESIPVQTLGYLVHVSTDPCEAILHHRLSFDLQPLIEHHRTVYGGDAPIIIKIHPNDRREGELIAVRYDP